MDVQEPLSAQQSRLQDDLRGLIRGDARCDDLTMRLFSSDGSPWQERPTGVVWPRSTQDVAAVVQYAEEKGLSVHFRGSGTGGTAGAIGSGLVVEFSRYMRRVLETGSDYVRVQPGAIRERVNGQLRATTGRFFCAQFGSRSDWNGREYSRGRQYRSALAPVRVAARERARINGRFRARRDLEFASLSREQSRS